MKQLFCCWHRRAWSAMVALLISFCCCSLPALSFDTPRGLYGLTDDNYSGLLSMTSPSTSWLASPDISGVSLRQFWGPLQPNSSQPIDLSKMISNVNMIGGSGKKVIVLITPGSYSPSWLYSNNTDQFGHTYPAAGSIVLQNGHRIPLPWDTTFQARWKQVINAMGAAFNNNPYVSGVVIAGPCADSAEMHLAYSSADYSNLLSNGFTVQKLKDAWQSTVAAYKAAFPSKSLIIHVQNPLPGWYNGQDMTTVNNDIVTTVEDQASETLSAWQLIVQHDSLHPLTKVQSWPHTWVTRMTTAVSGEHRQCNVGYQFLCPVTYDVIYPGQQPWNNPADFMEGLRVPTISDVGQAFNIGYYAPSYASFVEVYPRDIARSDPNGQPLEPCFSWWNKQIKSTYASGPQP